MLSPSVPANAETLESAVAAALTNHPSIEAAQAGLGVAEKEWREQFSEYFPEVSFSATGGRMYGDNATSRGLSVTRGAGYSYLGEGSITMRQRIFDGMETIHRVEAAEAREMQALANVLDVGETLSLRTAQAYIDVMRARTGLNLLLDHQKKVTEYLDRIAGMVDDGAADEAELQQARDVAVILEGIINDYQGQLRAAEARYAELTGYIPEADMERPVPSLDLIPEQAESALSFAQSSHPAILRAELESKAMGYEAEAQSSSLLPEIDGEVSYFKSSKRDLIGGETVDARAVLTANWGFSLGGAELASVERTKYAHREALARMNDLKRQIERDVRLAYSEYKTASRQLELLAQRSKLNEGLFETYKTQFEGAMITQLQLMQMENQLFTTRLERLNGEYRLMLAQYGVLASMGRLQESLDIASLEE